MDIVVLQQENLKLATNQKSVKKEDDFQGEFVTKIKANDQPLEKEEVKISTLYPLFPIFSPNTTPFQS